METFFCLVTAETLSERKRQLLGVLRQVFGNDVAQTIFPYALGFQARHEVTIPLQSDVTYMQAWEDRVLVLHEGSLSATVIDYKGNIIMSQEVPWPARVRTNKHLWILESTTLTCQELQMTFANIEHFEVFGENQAVALTTQRELRLLPTGELLATDVHPYCAYKLFVARDTILFSSHPSDGRFPLKVLYLSDRTIVHLADTAVGVDLVQSHVVQFRPYQGSPMVYFNLLSRSVVPTNDPFTDNFVQKVDIHFRKETTYFSVSTSNGWRFCLPQTTHEHCGSFAVGQVRELITGEFVLDTGYLGVVVLNFETHEVQQQMPLPGLRSKRTLGREIQ